MGRRKGITKTKVTNSGSTTKKSAANSTQNPGSAASPAPVSNRTKKDEASRNGRGNNRAAAAAAAVSPAVALTEEKKGLAIKDRAASASSKVIANEIPSLGLGDNHRGSASSNNGRALNQSAVALSSSASDVDLEATHKEHKYLHKKFKRTASAAVEFGGANSSEVAVSEAAGRRGGLTAKAEDSFPTIKVVGSDNNRSAGQVAAAKASPVSNFTENDTKSGALFSKSHIFRNGFNQISSETSCDSGPADASAISGENRATVALNARSASSSSLDYTNSRPECANNNHQRVQSAVAESCESVQLVGSTSTKHIDSGVDRDHQHHPHHSNHHHPHQVTDNSGGREAAELGNDCEAFDGSASANHVLHNNNNIGRNVCHYCNLNCTKPSVLEKHIRSHTNERPYPCVPCGFAFKTKSNLYKHRRSRAHQLRSQGADIPPGQGGPDDDISAGSDQELSSSASGSDEISRTASPVEDSMMGSAQQTDKPYKPKFHKAVLYNINEQQQLEDGIRNVPISASTCANNTTTTSSSCGTSVGGGPPPKGSATLPQQPQQQAPQPRQLLPAAATVTSSAANVSAKLNAFPANHVPPRLSHLASQPYNLEQHISKLISRNEAIIEDVEPALQKKYHKITGKSRGNSLDLNAGGASKAQAAALQQLQQFQARLNRDDGLNSHLLASQYNHLARRASTPAGLPIPNNFGLSSAPLMNLHSSVSVQSLNLAPKATKTKQNSSSGQPLNLSKPAVAGVPSKSASQPQFMEVAAPYSAATAVSSSGNYSQVPTSVQQKSVHNVSSLTTLITNKLLKNTNIPNMKDFIENLRKQLQADGCRPGSDINVANHPQNPEKSIIKGLLLDWNNGADNSASRENLGEGTSASEDGIHMCPVCRITFRNADTLQCHTKSYCQGNSSHSDKFSPNTLVNLARYKLRMTPNTQKSPSPLAKLAQTMLVRKPKPDNIVIPNSEERSHRMELHHSPRIVECVQAPLPSPGPLLGKTRLVDTYQMTPSTSSEIRVDKSPYPSHLSAIPEHTYMPSAMASNHSHLSYTHNRQMHVKAVPEPLVLSSSNQRSIDKRQSNAHQHHHHQLPSLEMFGGELQVIPKRFTSSSSGRHDDDVQREFSGGSIVSESPGSDSEQNQYSTRTPGLFSGGKVEKGTSSRASPPITPLTPSLLVTPNQFTPSFMVSGSHFQFPPINSITSYNPLTLPAIPSSMVLPPQTAAAAGLKMYCGRLIADVPGMPGPETMHLKIHPSMMHNTLFIPNVNRSPSPLRNQSRNLKRSSSASPVNVNTLMAPPQSNGLLKVVKVESGEEKLKSPKERRTSKPQIWSPANLHSDNKRSFYFNRGADNVSPRKEDGSVRSAEDKPIKLDSLKSPGRQQLHVDVDMSNNMDNSHKVHTPKFLRPSSLSLEPGTFTPKRHHGITPTANTLPLISPETPRPSKSCAQLYINGQAYTYLGLKCSTKPFYCTVNKTQPIYLPHHIPTISMYSQWQVCAESSPHPLGLKPDAVIGLYDSRQRQSDYSSVSLSSVTSLKGSQGPIMTPYETQRNHSIHHYVKRCPTPELAEPIAEPRQAIAAAGSDSSVQDDQKKDPNAPSVPLFGGYESNEDYEYIKGRGYGRFVCETCGIRCRKPSMLKKHIRTHTNIRPFNCQYCCFSFKTKGNLTKHMKSKSHAKKCEELGVSPLPTAEDMMEVVTPRNMDGSRLMTIPGDSDSEDDSDGDDQSDGSDTDDIKARLPQEQEAARGLLSLSMTPPIIMSQAATDTYRTAHTVMERIGEDLSVKSQSRPEIPVQKITFEFPRPEQYYSNPNIAKPASASVAIADDSDVPMDLTKPRSDKMPTSRVVFTSILEPASLISSLASITDKITVGNSVGPEMDENAQLQVYLTERAMHGTKMKQQQKRAYPSAANRYEPEEHSMLHQYLVERNHYDTPPAKQNHLPIASQVPPTRNGISVAEEPVEKAELEPELPAVETKPEPMPSGMDTLADVASISSKLGVQPVADGDSRNTNAKFVASEYLKMATQRNTMKSDREDGESSSDQEIVSDGSRKRTDSISDIVPRTVVVVKDPQKNNSEFVNVVNSPPCRIPPPTDDGRSICEVCFKSFQKPSQLKLHMNIHYLERKFRCEPCGVSFRTQGHFLKHERSISHQHKVSMTSTFGLPTTVNPRPFNCTDCRVAFRIHGHLAKHLRSKMHVLRLECLCKIPFGTYAEIERAGISLTAIDTTDCESSLSSFKALASQLPELKGATRPESGEESDNEDSEHGISNGYAEESLSGNENSDRSKVDENKNGIAMKRKFGTLLNHTNDTEEDQRSESADDHPGGGSQTDGTASVNSNEGGRKELEPASLASLEKRIKVT